jgi:hypothetical protein
MLAQRYQLTEAALRALPNREGVYALLRADANRLSGLSTTESEEWA